MEVRIGLVETPRELVVNTDQSPKDVETTLTAAITKEQPLVTLEDDKGRKYLIQTKNIAFVEIGVQDSRRVGFAPS